MYFTGLSKALYNASARKWKLSSCIICLNWIDSLIPARPCSILLPVPTFPCSCLCCPDGESTQRVSVAAVTNTGDDVSKPVDVLPGRIITKGRHRWETQETGSVPFHLSGICPSVVCATNAACAERNGAVGAQSRRQWENPVCVTSFGAAPLGTAEGVQRKVFLPPPTHPTLPCPRNMAPRLVQWVLRCRDLTG